MLDSLVLRNVFPSNFSFGSFDSVMKDFAAKDVPPFLYRTYWLGGHTSYAKGIGFQATDLETFISDLPPHVFHLILSRHLDWKHHSSLFISTHADRGHAENWALRQFERLRKTYDKQTYLGCELIEIDTSRLDKSILVFSVQELCKNT